MIPAVFLLIAMTVLPESPRWLARQDRWEDCHDVLALVHGKGDRNSPFVALELEDIKQMCEFERRHANVTYLDLFKPNMLNRTFIGIFTQIWSQLTGMNVMSTCSSSSSVPAAALNISFKCITSHMCLLWLAIPEMPISLHRQSNMLLMLS